MKINVARAGVSPVVDKSEGFFYNEVRLIRQVTDGAGLADVPVYITEWNSSIAYSYTKNMWANDHDLPNDAAFMCDAVKQANGHTDGFSHWTYSDVFEEWGLPGEEGPIEDGAFHGGFGLITYDGIHKPAYHAFAFLHKMGQNLVETRVDGPDNVDAMVTLDDGDLRILAWYYLDTIKKRQYSGPLARVSINLKTLPPGMKGKQLHAFRIDWDHGNPFAGWIEIGKPGELTPEQVNKLKNRSDDTLRDQSLDAVISHTELTLGFDLPPSAVVFFTTDTN